MLALLWPIDNRYQNQWFFTRTYRWLRWKPYYSLCFLIRKTKHFFKHSKDTRKYLNNFTWSLFMAQADMKMKHYYTLDEVLLDFDED